MHIEKPSPRKRLTQFLDRIKNRPVEWTVDAYIPFLKQIDAVTTRLMLRTRSDVQLKSLADSLRAPVAAGHRPPLFEATAFALAKESVRRTLHMEYFDVQLIAGLALYRGRVIEMQTGEGKTVTAVLPAFTTALEGKGVHILTFNDYLAKRDAEWMGPALDMLGVSRSYILGETPAAERRRAYQSEITYITARELGYDLLRESIIKNKDDGVMRPFHYAIVDEADSLMIDEARVPLVIAGDDNAEGEHGRFTIDQLVTRLQRGVDYTADDNSRNVFLTDAGHARVRESLGCGDLFDGSHRDLATRINQALHAHELLKRDVDYIVRGCEIEIIDENTGRIVKDRHWPDGLHLAVEAKEGLDIERQGRVLGSITVQHLLQLYPRISGMTGTVFPSEEEFFELMGLKTTVIPPNRPCIRVDRSDLLFATSKAKREAVIEEIRTAHARGRPVLVGTVTVGESEALASSLKSEGIDCRVLNASNDEQEAQIVSQAGAVGAVTVSTNMAGRGTDIKLGGADEQEREQVVALGGLYVIGTNRFESRRIDDQLRGRAGRQGDPGESRFFVSVEDDLMERFNLKEWIPKKRIPMAGGAPVDDKLIHEKIALTQRIVEGQNLDIRKTLHNYTTFVESQRQEIEQRRQTALTGSSVDKLRSLCPTRFTELESRLPMGVLEESAKQIHLYWIDKTWADHLARIADIREGIHLMRLGGKDPLYEFHKSVRESFETMEDETDAGIEVSFNRASITAEGLDLDREGLRGPSSTWTYLINDNPFDWLVDFAGSMGLSVGAGLLGGLFVLKAMIEKIKNRADRSN